ncbi:Lrp/AsnC family transcriptional regulator [Leucobacter zeae]|nr:Lrp/AsnC family transcriptional regulator [Leucobacter zeae]
MKLDRLDARLLRLLTDHPQLPAAECARRLNVARATVASRLERLHAQGVVEGIVPKIRHEGFDYRVVAFCSVEIHQGLGHEAVAESLAASVPEILDMYTVTGGADLQLRVAAPGPSELQGVFDRISQVPGIMRTSSSIALRTHFQDRVLPLVEHAADDSAGRAPRVE